MVRKTIDVVFFFGAGASAPFGIPTMKQFVPDFEKLLAEEGTKSEQTMYTIIKEGLERRLGKQHVDLEAIFTVIDGIIAYTPEKLGLLSTYLSTGLKNVTDDDSHTGKSLKLRFQNFVREKCIIPQESFDKIGMVYHDFFNRFALEFPEGINTNGSYAWHDSWTIFTTNYDTCLEHYWRVKAGVGIDTGFEFDRARNVNTLRSRRFLMGDSGKQLVKLHGSVNWLIEERTGDVVEEEMTSGHSHMGRRYVGEMMIYPVAEKELYLDPYISMLLRLNQDLERKSTWIVVGYSFNDPIVREIFVRRSNPTKHLVLVHPQAATVGAERLGGIRAKTSLVEKRFGLERDAIREVSVGQIITSLLMDEDFRKVNHQIIHKLKDNPAHSWEKTPTP